MRAEKPCSTFYICPALHELQQQGRAVGKNGKVFENLGALSSQNTLKTLHRLMQHFCPSRTLEIGMAFGGSALVFCASHKELGHWPKQQHTVLDPFQTTVWDSCGLMALERAGLSDFVDFREQTSALALPKMLEAEERFGFVYIDGSHLFEDVFLDTLYVLRLLTMGGVVAFDDSTNPHVAKVLGFLRVSIQGGLEEVDLTPFREGRTNLFYRLARRVGKVQLTAFRRIGDVERAWDSPFHSF
jgi:hypothetical protein